MWMSAQSVGNTIPPSVSAVVLEGALIVLQAKWTDNADGS